MIRLVVRAKEIITICKESGFKITTFDLLYFFDKSVRPKNVFFENG